MAAITEAPFQLVHPLILLGDDTTGVEIQCGANQVEASPEQDESVQETFCGSYTFYKPEVWTITVTALQSYGAAGLWNQVRPLVGQVIPFALRPDADAVVSADNPEMQGEARVKGFAFISGPVGEASEFDLVLAVQGTPVFAETPGALFTASAAAAPRDEG